MKKKMKKKNEAKKKRRTVVVMVARSAAATASARIPFCCFCVAIQRHVRGASSARVFRFRGVLLSAVLPLFSFHPSFVRGNVDTVRYVDLSVNYRVVMFFRACLISVRPSYRKDADW